MSKGAIVAIAIVVLVMAPAGFLLAHQIASGESLQLDLTLKLQSTAGNMEYRAAYHWGATHIDASLETNNVEWTKREAAASVKTSNNLTTAVKSFFSKVVIESDEFSVRRDGTWALTLQKRICQGVCVNLAVDGDNTTVASMIPSLSINYVPPALASALRSIGVDAVRVVITLSLNINGELVKQYLQDCFSVILFYANLPKALTDYFLGQIPAG